MCLIPLTLSQAEYEVTPALFSATQVYRPEWSWLTESIVIILTLEPTFESNTPLTYPMLWLLCSHDMFIGRSPLCTEHCVETKSP